MANKVYYIWKKHNDSINVYEVMTKGELSGKFMLVAANLTLTSVIKMFPNYEWIDFPPKTISELA